MDNPVRDPSGQALVCDQAASRLDPSGFDPSRVSRDIFLDHCKPGSHGALERYGATAAVAAIAAILDRDTLIDALSAELGDSYDCTRVWSAWGYGTMDEDDFVPVEQRVAEIADGLIAALLAQAMVARRAETLGSVHDQRGGEAMRPTLGDRLERMIAIQMEAYPEGWSDIDRRECAILHLFPIDTMETVTC